MLPLMSTTPASEPFDRRSPFTRRAAIAAGLDPGSLVGPAFRRIFRGVYVDASVAFTPGLRARAALVPFPPSAYLSHASAARVKQLPIPTLPDEHVTVEEKGHRRDRPGIRCHYRVGGRSVAWAGTRVSDHGQNFVELAELLPLVELVVVGDDMVRRGWLTVDDLMKQCAESTLPGAALARRAASYVRPGVDSPMETRLRMLIVLAGLPEPLVNHTLRDVDGDPVRRYDLCYLVSRTIVEYDGRQHIAREEQWESDLDRREAIDDDGWRILVIIAKGIYVHPERTLQRIHRVLLQRGEPGVPKVLSDDWRPHFPGRA